MFRELKRIKFNSFKGFIGSIGDDLPSLIPLFFALMIFFAALSFAFITINDRSATLNTYVDSLTIARSALGQGSYYDLDDFLSSQKQLATMSNYFYGLVYMSKTAGNNFEDIFSNYDLKSMFIQECKNKDLYFPTNSSSGFLISKTGTFDELSKGCGDGNIFFVASNSVSAKLDGGDSLALLQDIKHTKYFYYMYPVTLLTSKGYMVVYLLVMVW